MLVPCRLAKYMTFQVEIKCQGRFLENAVSDKLLQRLMKISSRRDSYSKIWNYEIALSLPVNIKGSTVVGGEAGGEVINIKIWGVRWRTCRPSASIVYAKHIQEHSVSTCLRNLGVKGTYPAIFCLCIIYLQIEKVYYVLCIRDYTP